jgi:hypothetical protein
MASPAVAAVGALIRQYFKDSRFWARSCNKLYGNCAPFDPSGVLVKTIILHAGMKMNQKHGISTNSPLGLAPDYVQVSIFSELASFNKLYGRVMVVWVYLQFYRSLGSTLWTYMSRI